MVIIVLPVLFWLEIIRSYVVWGLKAGQSPLTFLILFFPFVFRKKLICNIPSSLSLGGGLVSGMFFFFQVLPISKCCCMTVCAPKSLEWALFFAQICPLAPLPLMQPLELLLSCINHSLSWIFVYDPFYRNISILDFSIAALPQI